MFRALTLGTPMPTAEQGNKQLHCQQNIYQLEKLSANEPYSPGKPELETQLLNHLAISAWENEARNIMAESPRVHFIQATVMGGTVAKPHDRQERLLL